MRQQNNTHEALYVQRADPPFWVAPGEVVDWDSTIVGLTPVADDADAPQATTKKTKAATASGEGDKA